MLEKLDIKSFLKNASDDELKSMATLCHDELSLRRKRQGAINRVTLGPGDKATTINLRGVPDGTEVKILRVNRTRAVAKFPHGDYTVPLGCLVPQRAA